MSSLSNKAKEKFLSGFNCAQAVISVFCEKYGMDTDTALALTDGFGGGMRSGEICGAVSGAIAVIGLANAKNCENTDNAKLYTREKTVELTKAFKNKYEELVCRKLITGGRLNCANYVTFAVESLEEMGY